MKIDPYKHEERYKKWKEKVEASGIEGINQFAIEIFIYEKTEG